jgi:hypothetical protein
MSVSLAYLQRCASDTGFQVGTLEKVVRLGEFAADVARHPFLGEVLALKGGTALNLCFGSPVRLSVDLDFNYIGRADREGMLEDRPRVEVALTELARRQGYGVQQSANTFAGRKIFLSYTSVLGPRDRIEVDLNFLFRVPLVASQRQLLWQPGDLDRPEIHTVGLAEIVIGKLLALLDRSAGRDVWDAANLPAAAREIVITPAFRPLFVALASILIHPLHDYVLERIESLVTARVVQEQLLPMLASQTTVESQELCRRAWLIVEPLVRLDAVEREFIAAIFRGEIRENLLFPDAADVAATIAQHPALLWKVTNVRQHLAKPPKNR